jgi:gluconolactonase
MKIREIASGLQFPEGPVAMADGSVLLVEIARGTLSRVTPDGRMQVVADLGGGPNGAAIGPDGAVYVCNNGGFRYVHTGRLPAARWPRPTTIQRRPHRAREPGHRQGRAAVRQVDGIALRGPNDIVFDADGGFYFTDLGKVREREMDRGGVPRAMRRPQRPASWRTR